MSTRDQAEETPRRVGPYEIGGRIASGGMAHVYVARKAGARGKPVALKQPRADLDDRDFHRMFLDEARLAFQVNSAHCVEILDVGSDGGVPYYVMPLVVGTPLSKLMARVAIAPRIAAEIAAQAALGLHDAHCARDARGELLQIVHRDVSPQNVLLDVDGRVRVADFGVARAAQRSVRTRTGQVKGKLGYLSPEQAQARPLDGRSDVFSLGIVLWEMLAGERLYKGGSLLELHARLVGSPVVHPSTKAPGVPRAIGDVALAALERDPSRRLQDAVTFAELLRAASPERVSAQELGAFVAREAAEEVQRLRTILQRVANHDDTLLSLTLPELRDGTEETATEVHPGPWAGSTEVAPPASGEGPTRMLGLRGLVERLRGRR